MIRHKCHGEWRGYGPLVCSIHRGQFNFEEYHETHQLEDQFYLYTDGSCGPTNPGYGGWSFILKLGDIVVAKESGGMMKSTNNEMELTAAIYGMRALLRLRALNVTIVSDSKYLLNGLGEWMHDWKKREWRNAKGNKVKNQDLWQKLDGMAENFNLTLEHVRAHKGHPENEECDRLAKAAYGNLIPPIPREGEQS